MYELSRRLAAWIARNPNSDLWRVDGTERFVKLFSSGSFRISPEDQMIDMHISLQFCLTSLVSCDMHAVPWEFIDLYDAFKDTGIVDEFVSSVRGGATRQGAGGGRVRPLLVLGIWIWAAGLAAAWAYLTFF